MEKMIDPDFKLKICDNKNYYIMLTSTGYENFKHQLIGRLTLLKKDTDEIIVDKLGTVVEFLSGKGYDIDTAQILFSDRIRKNNGKYT